jgi:predicted GNAT family acetyltransferase
MAETADQIELSDRKSLNRYEIRIGGELAGLADYRLDDDRINFLHTEVDPAHGGQGLGGKLIEFAVTDARSRGLEIIPSCPFVKAWVDEHPEAS